MLSSVSFTRFIPKTSFAAILLKAPFLPREVGALEFVPREGGTSLQARVVTEERAELPLLLRVPFLPREVGALEFVPREGGTSLQARVVTEERAELPLLLRVPFLPREAGEVDLSLAYRSVALQGAALLRRISPKLLVALSVQEISSLPKEEIMKHMARILINMENLTLFTASLSLEPAKAGLLLEKIIPEEGIVLTESSAKALVSRMSGREALFLLRLLVENQEGVAQAEVPNLDEALTETEVKNILYRLITDGGLALSKNSSLLLLQASVQESIANQELLSAAALRLIAGGIKGSFIEEKPLLVPEAQQRVILVKKKIKQVPVEKTEAPTTVSMVQMYRTAQIRDESFRKQEFLEIAGPLLSDHGHLVETRMSVELFFKECGFTQDTLDAIYREPSMVKMQVFINRLRYDPAFQTVSSFRQETPERKAFVNGRFNSWHQH